MKITLPTLVLPLLLLWIPGDAYELCPPSNEALSQGIPCGQECYGDGYCTPNVTMCCQTTHCGLQCITPYPVPYHPPVLGCPKVPADTIATCDESCDNCADNEQCCSNGCGHVCKETVQVTPICRGIIDSYEGTPPLGAYIPQCSADGTFSSVQYHESYYWCVRPQTGEPVGKAMSRYQPPQCNNCSHNGEVYYPGDSFPDDCNTCYCYEDGSASCTEIGCNVPTEPPSSNNSCFHYGSLYHPGDEFKEDCNTCTCLEDGTIACTLIACKPPNSTSSFLSCPVMEDDMAGICVDSCTSDNDCNSGQKCCSNGCGHTCMDAISIPFVAPPRNCPEQWDEAICDIHECTDSCEGSKLCCENKCGSTFCMDGLLPLYPCTATVNSVTGAELLGKFVPQCDEVDGTFKAVQCFSHYCWCVDTASGEPTSDMVESGDVAKLNCSGGCVHNGKIYNNNDIIGHHGECAKSVCRDGKIVKTEVCYPCQYNGHTIQHNEKTPNDCYCSCYDGAIMCASDMEGDCDDGEVSSLAWWHSVLIGAGILIVVLVIIAIALLVVVLTLRHSQMHHKKLQEAAGVISLENEYQVLFKNGPHEAESVELKVPVEDDGDPVKT